MATKANHYRITLEALQVNDVSKSNYPPLIFECSNHDDLFEIIERAKGKGLFEHQTDAVSFALGLKLFSEVLLKNKNNPLFTELKPALGAFMKKLKQS